MFNEKCKIIYSPKGQAYEYAEFAVNPYRGCGHACSYCYVPRVIKIDRREFDAAAIPRKDFIKLLTREAAIYQAANIKEQIMLSFTTDPYHPFDNSLTRRVLQCLNFYRLPFCTLTKGGSRALRDLDLFDQKKDSFASTLTSVDDSFSAKWERGAATSTDRIATLKKFFERGIFTWVSIEPTLNAEESLKIIRETRSFVNLFKIGRANYLPMTMKTDWRDYTLRVIDLCNKFSIQHYVKKDLQCYLPEGYFNSLRRCQHN